MARYGVAARAEDAVLLLVLVFAAPLLILLIGMPLALGLRAVIELLGRL